MFTRLSGTVGSTKHMSCLMPTQAFPSNGFGGCLSPVRVPKVKSQEFSVNSGKTREMMVPKGYITMQTQALREV